MLRYSAYIEEEEFVSSDEKGLKKVRSHQNGSECKWYGYTEHATMNDSLTVLALHSLFHA